MLFAVVTALVGIPPAAFAQQGPQVIERRVQTPRYDLSSGGISVPDAAITDVPGTPQLPVKGFTRAVATDRRLGDDIRVLRTVRSCLTWWTSHRRQCQILT